MAFLNIWLYQFLGPVMTETPRRGRIQIEMISRMWYIITFPGVKMRLVGWYFPGSSFLPLLKVRVTFAFYQSSGTPQSLQPFKNDREQPHCCVRHLSQHSGCILSGPTDVSNLSSSLTQSSLTEGKSSVLRLTVTFLCRSHILTSNISSLT